MICMCMMCLHLCVIHMYVRFVHSHDDMCDVFVCMYMLSEIHVYVMSVYVT